MKNLKGNFLSEKEAIETPSNLECFLKKKKKVFSDDESVRYASKKWRALQADPSIGH